MSAPQGNRFWELRAKSGAAPKYSNPEDLRSDCIDYFEWVQSNPLMSTEKVAFQGTAKNHEVPKMRAMTLVGLCNFIGIVRATWYAWKDKVGGQYRDDLSDIITWAEEIIYQQKFEGAAADLLNPNIIVRDLGLSDKKELMGENGGPIQFANLTDEELERRIAELSGET